MADAPAAAAQTPAAAPPAQGATPAPKAPTSPPVAGSAASPNAAPATSTPSQSSADTAASTEPGDVKLAKRLARIASEEKRVREDREAFEAKAKEQAARLEKLDRFEKAKATSRIAALKELFDEGEITGDLYAEMSDHVLASIKEPTPEDKVKAAIKAELDERKKAEDDAAKKAADEKKAKAEEERKAVQDEFRSVTVKLFEHDATKWPTIRAGVFPQVETAEQVAAEVMALVDGHFEQSLERDANGHPTKKGEVLTPAQALDMIEAHLSERLKKAQPPAQQQPVGDSGSGGPKREAPSASPASTVTRSWSSDQATPPNPVRSLDDAWKEAKRRAGIGAA